MDESLRILARKIADVISMFLLTFMLGLVVLSIVVFVIYYNAGAGEVMDVIVTIDSNARQLAELPDLDDLSFVIASRNNATYYADGEHAWAVVEIPLPVIGQIIPLSFPIQTPKVHTSVSWRFDNGSLRLGRGVYEFVVRRADNNTFLVRMGG